MGTRTSPTGERRMCGMGLSETWPPSNAVVSPPILAARACAPSWHVVENKENDIPDNAEHEEVGSHTGVRLCVRRKLCKHSVMRQQSHSDCEIVRRKNMKAKAIGFTIFVVLAAYCMAADGDRRHIVLPRPSEFKGLPFSEAFWLARRFMSADTLESIQRRAKQGLPPRKTRNLLWME